MIFRVILVSWENEEGTEISHTPSAPTHSWAPPLGANTPRQGGTRITTDELTLTRHTYSKFISGFTVGVVHSVGFDKYTMTCLHLYSLTQSSFTALNTT